MKKIIASVFMTLGVGIVCYEFIESLNYTKQFNEEKQLIDLTLGNVEALAGGEEHEFNSWSQWLNQGLTKDEQAHPVPCGSVEVTENDVSLEANVRGVKIHGEYYGTRREYSENSTAERITCQYGYDNCSETEC